MKNSFKKIVVGASALVFVGVSSFPAGIALATSCVLSITKSVNKTTAQVGDTLTYAITVKNTGTSDCTGGGVKIVDILDAHLTFLSETHTSNINAGYGSTPLYQSSNRTLSWNGNVLMPGESGTITWQAKINTDQTQSNFDIANTAKITADQYNNMTTWVNSNTVHTTVSNALPGSAPQVTTATATNVAETTAIANGNVNPNGAATTYWFEYGTTTVLGQATTHQSAGSGSTNQSFSAPLSGLTENTTYYFRIVAQNSLSTTHGSILSFTTTVAVPQGSTPQVVTTAATNVAETTAIANGNVNPNGAATTYWFEYGTTNGLGSATAQQSAGSGSTNQQISASLSSLSDNTTYYFRIVAQNSFGTSRGSIFNFTTDSAAQRGNPPTVSTGPATNFGQTTATVGGTINPASLNTQYWFEYGTTIALGQSTPNQIILGTVGTSVGANLSGLTPGTVYYYRIAGQNQYGTSRGSIRNFTTQSQGSAPLVQTVAPIGISTNSATLQGMVDGQNISTNYWFEYGTTVTLGSITPTQTLASNGLQGVATVVTSLNANTTYFFRVVAQNPAGIAQGTIMSFSTTNSGGGGGGGSNNGQAPVATTFSANTNNGYGNNSAVLNGSVNPNNANTNYWFEYGTSGNFGYSTSMQSIGSGSSAQNVSQTIYGLQPNTTYYFRIVAQSQYGISQGSTQTFYSYYQNYGGGGGGYGTPNVQTLNATGINNTYAALNGTANFFGNTGSYWFEYGTNNSFGNTTQYQTFNSNTDVTVAASINNLTPGATYYFRIVAQNQYNISRGNTFSFTTTGSGASQPQVTTNSANITANTSATLQGSVNANGSQTDTWFEYGTSAGSLTYTTPIYNVGLGNYAVNISQSIVNLTAGTTYYVRAVGRNQYGTQYGQTLIFTMTGASQGTGVVPLAVTSPATIISQNAALLNGQVGPQSSATTAWFEYGTTAAFGLTTSPQSMGVGTTLLPLSVAVTGLSASTIYYFRTVAQNQYGTIRGSILTFRTNATVVAVTPTSAPPPTIIVTAPAPTGAGECFIPRPAIDLSSLNAGADFIYTVTYRNNCGTPISNVLLKVTLPTDVTFVSTNYPFNTVDNNTITFNLGVLPAGFEGSILIKGTVKIAVREGDTFIFGAQTDWNDTRGNPHSASTYMTVPVGKGRAFSTASIFGIISGLGGWWWWLLLLILLAIVMYLIFFRDKEKKSPSVATITTI